MRNLPSALKQIAGKQNGMTDQRKQNYQSYDGLINGSIKDVVSYYISIEYIFTDACRFPAIEILVFF